MILNERRRMEKRYQVSNTRFFKYSFSQEELNFIISAYCDKSWGTPKIARHFHVSPTTINTVLRQQGIKIKNNREKSLKYSCDEHYFDRIDSEHKAYWLGFIYADGYVSAPTSQSSGKFGLSIHVKDKDLLERLKTDLKYTGTIHQYDQTTPYGKTSFCRINICSNILYNGLVDKGVVPLKTLKLIFPSIEKLPVIFYRHFIRGYLDGDGSITRNSSTNPQATLKFCGTLEMLEAIQRILKVQHLVLEHKKELGDKNNFQLTIGGNNQVYRILKWLYQDTTIYLQRKFDIAQQLFNKKEGSYE